LGAAAIKYFAAHQFMRAHITQVDLQHRIRKRAWDHVVHARLFAEVLRAQSAIEENPRLSSVEGTSGLLNTSTGVSSA
jgi:hypothetical protein